MGYAIQKKLISAMRCETKGYTGEYASTTVSRVFEYHGNTVVVEGIPAQVCEVCSEVVFAAGMHGIVCELLRNAQSKPTAPVCSNMVSPR